MTNQVFGKEYADQYDTFYHDKNYEAECDMIEEVFRSYAGKPVKSILDLGCGTGNHALSLARRGYQVTGVDSSHEMITQAKAKLQSHTSSFQYQPLFLEGDVRSLVIPKKWKKLSPEHLNPEPVNDYEKSNSFDAVIMMFAVLGYQLTNDDVANTLCTVRRHLKIGGVFLFDVWYGPAVLGIRPSGKIREIPTSDGKIIRMASSELDVRHHLCEVNYRLLQIAGDRVSCNSNETHRMRYFFPMEIEQMLTCNEMKLENLTAFPDLGKPADETTWNVLGIGKAL